MATAEAAESAKESSCAACEEGHCSEPAHAHAHDAVIVVASEVELRARVAALETQLSDSAPKDTIPGSISASDETLVKRLQDAERRANDAEASGTTARDIARLHPPSRVVLDAHRRLGRARPNDQR